MVANRNVSDFTHEERKITDSYPKNLEISESQAKETVYALKDFFDKYLFKNVFGITPDVGIRQIQDYIEKILPATNITFKDKLIGINNEIFNVVSENKPTLQNRAAFWSIFHHVPVEIQTLYEHLQDLKRNEQFFTNKESVIKFDQNFSQDLLDKYSGSNIFASEVLTDTEVSNEFKEHEDSVPDSRLK